MIPAAAQRAATDAVRAALASGFSPAEVAEAALAAAEREYPHDSVPQPQRDLESTLAARIDLGPRPTRWKRSATTYPDLPPTRMDDQPFGFGVTAMSQIPDSTGTGE